MMFGQLKVQSNGDVIIGSSLGTNASVPVVFKVSGNLAGSTGISGSPYNVSFGYGALSHLSLVKAVQELSEQNNRLQEQINELTAKLDELSSAPKSPNVGVIDESGGTNNFSFSMFPNPTNGLVTIDYTLFADASLSIELYNMFGQRVKLIASKQSQKAGAYSVQTSVGGLVAGTYIVKVTSGNQIESKQLFINN